jgi:hypothetical protein
MGNYNTFSRITVDGYAFSSAPDVTFTYRHSNLNFSLVWEGTGIIEYSFDGTNVHGDMQNGQPTQAMFFDNRNVGAIWFRLVSGSGTVRVEGWW